jgi:hypothetical protein
LSEKEQLTYRLTHFNEKIQVLLSKILTSNSFDEINTEKYQVKDPAYIAPHLKVGLGVINPVVLTVGDPFRCDIVSDMCEEAKEIKWNREYRIFNLKFNG